MRFNHFDKYGIYRVFTVGGHDFVLAILNQRDGSVSGKEVSLDDLRTNHPSRTVSDYVDDQNTVDVRLESIEARTYLGRLDDYEVDDE